MLEKNLDLRSFSGTLGYKEFFRIQAETGASITARLSFATIDGGKTFSETKNGK